METKNIDQLTVDTLRFLSVDMVTRAYSGHPGQPLGVAPMAYALWKDHLNHNPKNVNFLNRDRFVLSAGHGSALLYSLLHVFGYDLTLEDLKNFRTLHSKTPGHPEYRYTVGVEATTGPLGQGIAMATGMAMAEKHMAAIFNTDDEMLVDHFTYAICGEGCLMEGVSGEASSLAGTLGLSKLIVLFDSNDITIDGRIDISFTEDVKKRYEAYNWQVLTVEDGENVDDISTAISHAKKENEKPTLLIIKTKIGRGTQAEDTPAAHGMPLSLEEISAMKKTANFPAEAFHVPKAVYDQMAIWQEKASQKEALWIKTLETYKIKYPALYETWVSFHHVPTLEDLSSISAIWAIQEDLPTRVSSNHILNILTKNIPNLWGGSADLSGSNGTNILDGGSFLASNPSGRNIHFGVREHAMSAISNGIMLHGGLRIFVGTFLVFSDYMKPALRLSALMNIPVINILTHDSIGVGEDGPTHQPVEQLIALRSIPNFTVFRPADNTEVAASWILALTRSGPSALALTRQRLPHLEGSSKEALQGGYIIEKEMNKPIDAIFIATGSEVSLAIEAAAILKTDNISIRVVSMLSVEVFEAQDAVYKESILPKHFKNKLVIEAASPIGWHKYAGDHGEIISMKGFGESAPAPTLYEYFGITVDDIVKRTKYMIERNK